MQTTIYSIFVTYNQLLDELVYAATAIAVIVFVWGMVQYIYEVGNGGGESEKGRSAGKKRMLYGVVGLFIIVSVWGIVGLLTEIFGVSNTSVEPAPIITL